MDDFENAEQERSLDGESFDFAELETRLTADLDAELSDLEWLKEDREMIGNPDSLGSVVLDVVWDQFVMQIGAVAGEDFIKENRGLKLDLSEEAHFQKTKNFAKGNIATHNTIIDYQQRYDDWQSNFVKDSDGKVVMHDTRIPKRDKDGNIIIGSDGKPIMKQVETLVKGARAPYDEERKKRGLVGSAERGTDMDETVSVSEIIRDPSANAHMTQKERIEFDLSEKNLNEMDSRWNRSKGETPTNEWLDNTNSKGQKPQEIFDNMTDEDVEKLRQKDAEAREEFGKRKEEAEQRSIKAGKQSRKEEAFRIGGKALRAAVMGLLAELIRTIVQKFIAWLRSKEKNLDTFIEQLKGAIKDFISNLKQNVLTSGLTVGTTVLTAIYGPIVSTIKKAWVFLKQGAKSLKEAFDYLKDPQNRRKPISILLIEVGKIVAAGITAAGAIALGEVIEKGLSTIPGFGVEIPLIGSLANILGIFLGALVSGLVGALALNLMDRAIAKIAKRHNLENQIDKKNEILVTQNKLLDVTVQKAEQTKSDTIESISSRHRSAVEAISDALTTIYHDDDTDNVDRLAAIDRDLEDLLGDE